MNWIDGLFDLCQVTSRVGNNLYHQSEHVQSGHFAFVAVENGDYIACFWTTNHEPQITITIDFDWRAGVAAKDWSNVAKKSHIDVSGCVMCIN